MPSPGSIDQPGMRLGSIGFLILLLLSLIVVAVAWVAHPPEYWAEAYVNCISDVPSRSGEFGGPHMSDERHRRFLAGQALAALSPEVLNAVLHTAEVRSTDWFARADKTRLREVLKDDLRAHPVEDTSYFRVAMGCRVPEDAAAIVNQVAAIYLETQRNRAAETYRRELAGYQREQETYASLITDKLRQIQDFASVLPPGELRSQGALSPTLAELIELQKQVTALELQTRELESIVRMYTEDAGPAVTVEDAHVVEENPRVMSLADQVTALEIELEVLSAGNNPEPSGVKVLKTRLEATRRQLDAIRETTLRRIRGFRQEQAQSAFLSSQHTLLLVREKLDDARARQADLDSQLAQAETLMDELEILRQTKERLDVNTREVERVVRNQTALRVEVAQHAVEPQGRYFGFHIRLTAVALAVPVLFGLGLMLARAASGRSVERMPGGPKE